MRPASDTRPRPSRFFAAAFLGASCLLRAWTAETPWQAMDYGPFFSTTLGSRGPGTAFPTNLTHKAIAVNLGGPPGQQTAIAFDTDLLRYSVGWTGSFVALKGVAFDGEHWAHPLTDGSAQFANPAAPGWARPGSEDFHDPRSEPYGPLPRNHAAWQGIHVHGSNVVFRYQVGDMPVLDRPGLAVFPHPGHPPVFTRTLELGPSTSPQTLQVLQEPGRSPTPIPGLDPSPAPTSIDRTALWLPPQPGTTPADTSAPAVAVIGAPPGARWLTDAATGQVRLAIPPHARTVQVKLLIWRTDPARLAATAAAILRSPAPEPLEPLTRPGPSRWPQSLQTQGRPGTNNGPFAIDDLTPPDANPWNSWLRFSGIDFFHNGRRAAVSTWNGDVWIVSNIEGSLENLAWRRIAAGLHQPLGLRIVDDEIYVLGRDQITRLRDANGDGETDFYENFNNDAKVGEHFHEFANDLKLGSDGWFYYLKCARHALPAAHSQHGTLIRVSRDGRTSEVVARGFRAVNGLGVGPNLELTTVDNQGHWMPANRINWVRPGGWYGNLWAWNPDQRTDYDPPLAWVHNSIDRSGGTHLWVPQDRWNPIHGRLLTLSYGMGHAFLILHETIDDARHGALTRLPLDFDTGVMRGAFHPGNGHLYACGLYGWAGNRTRPGGLYRIRRTQLPLHIPTDFHAAHDGLVVTFSEPLDPSSATDPGNYDLKAWNYRWSANYGSPDLRHNGAEGRDTWRIESAALAANGRSVFLRIPELRPTMQFHLAFKLRAGDGTALDNFIHGTLHRTANDAGLALLGPNPILRETTADSIAPNHAPGLIEILHAGTPPIPADTRHARLPAFHLPQGTPASPYLPSQPTRIRWEGWLKVDLNSAARFHPEGHGHVRLHLNGQPVLDLDLPKPNPSHPTTPNPPPASAVTPLRQGLNRFELEYAPPPDAPAEFRLAWSAPSHPREPIPSTAFVHDPADGQLRHADALRAGRELFANHSCASCHRPATPWGDHAMPELAARAPAFDAIGDRLDAAWIARWLADPAQLRPDARMPRLLHGPSADTDARDIATFLSNLRQPQPTQAAHTAGSHDTGKLTFLKLGCVACHTPPGERPTDPADSRLPLDGLHAKWKPGALADHLQAPHQHHAWTRMPDFDLTTDEAADLEAFLRVSSASKPTPAWVGGDPARGAKRAAELGCYRCHDLQGAKDLRRMPDLTAITRADGLRGCLATNPRDRRTAPEFAFNDLQRSLLRAFLKADPASALRHDPPTEFATRQIRTLQCQACHARDTEPDRLAALLNPTGAPVPTDEDAAGATAHPGRPPLTHAGEKLHAAWIERLLSGTLGYKPRADLPDRMPAFPAYAAGLAAGLAHQHGFPARTTEEHPAPNPELVELGRRLTLVEGGFGCVTCHGVGPQKALAGQDTATINFIHVAERLRPSYYRRYVLDPQRVMPGTMMPTFVGPDGRTSLQAVLDGDPHNQFNAIWLYLRSLNNRPATP